MTESSYHVAHSPSIVSTASFPGFQLPQADIVADTEPALFEEVPDSYLTPAHLTLRNWPYAGDRMMVAYLLPVSPPAQKVATILLWHGWGSYPSRERIARMAGIPALNNVSRALKELEDADSLYRRRRVESGRGFVGNFYLFNGLAVCQAIVLQGHPTLLVYAQEILDFYAAAAAEARSIESIPRGGQPVARSIDSIPPVYPGDTPGVSSRYQNHNDLIDLNTEIGISINQEVPGPLSIDSIPRGSEALEPEAVSPIRPALGECPSCGRRTDPTRSLCLHCGTELYDLPGADGPAVGDSSPVVGEGPGDPPAWYLELASRVAAENVPDWRALWEDQLLCQFTDEVMVEAAARYGRQYASQRVSVPHALFRKIASGLVDELRRRGGTMSAESRVPRDFTRR